MKTIAKLSLMSVLIFSLNEIKGQAEGPPWHQGSGTSCQPDATPWHLGGDNIALPPNYTPNSPPGSCLSCPVPVTDAGTCNDFPFILKANNFQSVYITQTGKIGINNPTPRAALDILNPVSTNQSSLRIFGDQMGTVQTLSHMSLFYGNTADFSISEGLPFTSGSSQWFTIKNGNVGIDEVAPAEKLQVNGNTRIVGNLGVGAYPALEKAHIAGGNLRVDGNVGIGGGMGLNSEKLFVSGGNFRLDGKIGINSPAGSENIYINDNTSASIKLWTGSANPSSLELANTAGDHKYFVDASGVGRIHDQLMNVNMINFTSLWASPSLNVPQVWIGKRPTTNHQFFQFAVDGELVAKSIFVSINCGWADYVFASDYKLPNLKDVEEFYTVNQHLPEIPTAKEVEENGVDVAEMNKLLLKKVEELTIYLVNQQKEIEAIKKGLGK